MTTRRIAANLNLTPAQIVTTLDNYIVGQKAAKRAVAVALRNRWRRRSLTDTELQASIVPKNILMLGPTGVGKTEISRRMAKLTDAPFVKVEATKYTEVGFKGKDVESIIEDLYSVSKNVARRQLEKEATIEAEGIVENLIVSLLAKKKEILETEAKALLEGGKSEDEEITFEITVFQEEKSRKIGEGQRDGLSFDVFAPLGGEEFSRPHIKKFVTQPIKTARQMLKEEELKRLVAQPTVDQYAQRLCEEEGIVFIDEIDKIVVPATNRDKDLSAEGVQQDLLPIIEGTTVTMKDNVSIKTDSILFIASGAFHNVKPSDIIAELQGRLPVRVELEALTEADFYHILTTPKFNLLKQHEALLKTEGIELTYEESAIREIAKAAREINQAAQNIGARRLYSVLELVMEKFSFSVEEYKGQSIVVTKEVVMEAADKFRKKSDLAKYLL